MADDKAEDDDDDYAKAEDDELFVCFACGKTSTTKGGFDGTAMSGWDVTCMNNSVRIKKEKLDFDANGYVIKIQGRSEYLRKKYGIRQTADEIDRPRTVTQDENAKVFAGAAHMDDKQFIALVENALRDTPKDKKPALYRALWKALMSEAKP